MELDLADIQGTILRGYRVTYVRHFVLHVTDPPGARRFLGHLAHGHRALGVPRVTTAERWPAKPRSFLNVGLTYQGLLALGLPEQDLRFPAAFRRGATDPGTAEAVGDTGNSAPAQWVGGLSDGAQVHLILSLWATDSLDVLEEVSARLRAAFGGGLGELSHQDATAMADNKVHFGYTDNISQPNVEGTPPRKPRYRDGQPLTPVGEFLLGYPNQSGHEARYEVQPAVLSKNSSFSAYRILEQDVAGFEEFLTTYSAQVGTDRETLAAKVCGRWRNGVPLVLSPDTAEPAPPIPREMLNDFDYIDSDPATDEKDEKDDTNGFRCPIGAHIRRGNPRSQPIVGSGNHTHRIVRRGMPYGPPYDPSRPYDGVPRGLVGHFINADLANQFEFLMRQWMNGDTFVRSVPNEGGDPVLNISGRDVFVGANDPPPPRRSPSRAPGRTRNWSTSRDSSRPGAARTATSPASPRCATWPSSPPESPCYSLPSDGAAKFANIDERLKWVPVNCTVVGVRHRIGGVDMPLYRPSSPWGEKNDAQPENRRPLRARHRNSRPRSRG
jgi:deferrochelatase/peroxidase EfeB